MEKTNIVELLKASIKLELQIADIYKLYYDLFPDDQEFWWRLVIEEEGHAALLRSGKEHYLPANSFPEKILSPSISKVLNANNMVNDYIVKIKTDPPSREEAFSTAYYLEHSVGELSYQAFMEKLPETKLESIFQKLNVDSKNHADRVFDYMKNHDIRLVDTRALVPES